MWQLSRRRENGAQNNVSIAFEIAILSGSNGNGSIISVSWKSEGLQSTRGKNKRFLFSIFKAPEK